jgi:hypothetical protein
VVRLGVQAELVLGGIKASSPQGGRDIVLDQYLLGLVRYVLCASLWGPNAHCDQHVLIAPVALLFCLVDELGLRRMLLLRLRSATDVHASSRRCITR